MSGNSDSDDEPPAYSEVAPPTAYLRFPSELSLYNVGADLYLAAHRTQPLHHVQVNYRQIVPPDAEIALSTGPNGGFPAYASIRLYGSNISIWAPKQSELDMSQVAISVTPPTGPFGIVHGSWAFTVPVQDTGRLEEFEWRHSVVPEVLSVVSSEWKLERRQPSRSGEASGSSSGAGAPKPTEKETVATLSLKKNSRSKFFTIQFQGSGANGELGDRWAVVTILTALAIYYKPGSGSATTSTIGEGSSTS